MEKITDMKKQKIIKKRKHKKLRKRKEKEEEGGIKHIPSGKITEMKIKNTKKIKRNRKN